MEKLVDVRGKSEAELTQVVGSFARTLLELAHGQDSRLVEPNRERKSVGSETTFADDLLDKDRITDEIRTLAKECTDWLARHELFARTVTLKVRYDNFQTITRSETASRASRSEEQLTERAIALLEKTAAGQRPIRLLGVSLHGLSDDDMDTEALTSTAVTVPREGPVQLSLPFPSPRSCP